MTPSQAAENLRLMAEAVATEKTWHPWKFLPKELHGHAVQTWFQTFTGMSPEVFDEHWISCDNWGSTFCQDFDLDTVILAWLFLAEAVESGDIPC